MTYEKKKKTKKKTINKINGQKPNNRTTQPGRSRFNLGNEKLT